MSISLAMSARDRRTLIAGVAVMLSIVLIGRGLPALQRWQSDREAAALQSMRMVAIAFRSIRQLPMLRRSVAARVRRLSLADSTLLHGDSPAAAAAELASVLSDIADENDVEVAALSMHADSGFRSDFARASVRLSGTTDVQGLAAMLHDIEAGSHLLAVRELVVGQPDAGAPDTRPEALHVELLIDGLARRNGPAAGASR